MKGITTCLWFDTQAEEAARFYTSVFKNSSIGKITRYGDASPMPKGTAMTVEFEINGQKLLAFNGGPQFKFTEAISLMVSCENQQEIDEYWSKLTAGGGQEVQCGWLRDKYGLSWQITPTILGELVNESDPARSNRVMQALLQMKKLDIKALQDAAAGQTSGART